MDNLDTTGFSLDPMAVNRLLEEAKTMNSQILNNTQWWAEMISLWPIDKTIMSGFYKEICDELLPHMQRHQVFKS